MPPSPAPPAIAASGRLPALDGIRALAVVAVLLFHLRVPGFAGGFVGVDVFFVLSGFLITGLLLQDVSRHGSVRLGHFWARRFRRLMPAFVLVVLTVIVWSATVALPMQREALRADAVWSLLYVANWHFIDTASYFENTGAPSPLQHVWSLAVEEQFYVVWPLVVAALAVLGRRRMRRGGGHAEPGAGERAIVGRVLAGALVLSAISVVLLAVLSDATSPERAYMGTDTKAFEPLAGAALACAFSSSRVRAWCTRRATPLIAVGLSTLAVGTGTLGTAEAGAVDRYYTGAAALFTVGSLALVAGAATGAGSVLGRGIGWLPLAWLGQISYGIYLWHWPLRVWIIPDDGFQPWRGATVAVLTVLMAAASFYLVERPVREGDVSLWLSGRRTLITAVTVLAAALALTGMIRTPAPPPQVTSIAFVGDSVPQRLAPMLAEWAQKNPAYSAWQVSDASVGGCSPMPIVLRLGDASTSHLKNADCPRRVSSTQEDVLSQASPDVVVWWSRAELYDRLGPDGEYLPVGTAPFWAAQQADLHERVVWLTERTGGRVVLVGTDRPGTRIRDRCTPGECHPFLRRLADRDELRRAWNQLLADEAARTPGVSYIEIDDVYCRDAASPCVDTVDDVPARPDGTHFSVAGADLVSGPLLSRVTEAARAEEPG